jgi:S-adenosylmethionine decarboxylase
VSVDTQPNIQAVWRGVGMNSGITNGVGHGQAFAMGTHCLLDVTGCDAAQLDSLPAMRTMLETAAKIAGATVLGTHEHKFSPQGLSIVCLLSESHISIHTWPESGCATIDMYTCGDHCRPRSACEYILEKLKPSNYALSQIARGENLQHARKSA